MRMIVNRRALFHQRINVGNGDQNFGSAVSQGFGNGELIEIARIVIINRAPQQLGLIANVGILLLLFLIFLDYLLGFLLFRLGSNLIPELRHEEAGRPAFGWHRP